MIAHNLNLFQRHNDQSGFDRVLAKLGHTLGLLEEFARRPEGLQCTQSETLPVPRRDRAQAFAHDPHLENRGTGHGRRAHAPVVSCKFIYKIQKVLTL